MGNAWAMKLSPEIQPVQATPEKEANKRNLVAYFLQERMDRVESQRRGRPIQETLKIFEEMKVLCLPIISFLAELVDVWCSKVMLTDALQCIATTIKTLLFQI